MKQKITALLLACMISVTGLWFGNGEVHAAEEPQGQNIDYSYLMSDNALIGYTELQTWGVYLMNGTSVITKMSANTIGAGGNTTAAVRCTVTITSIVERYENGSWLRVTSWTQTNENAFSAMISKSLIVARGNTYRVRSYHYAATDFSNSFTGHLVLD